VHAAHHLHVEARLQRLHPAVDQAHAHVGLAGGQRLEHLVGRAGPVQQLDVEPVLLEEAALQRHRHRRQAEARLAPGEGELARLRPGRGAQQAAEPTTAAAAPACSTLRRESIERERALEGRARAAALVEGLDPRVRCQQIGMADAAQHAGHHQVGHGEPGAGEPVAALQVPIEFAQPAAGELRQFGVEPGGGLVAVEHPDQVHADQRGAHGGDGGEAPLDDAGAPLDVAGDQLAGLLGQVERDGRRFGHHETVVVDHRRLAEGADPAVGVAVELAAGVVERVDAVGQAGLLERPLHPEVLGLAMALGKDASESVERDHAVDLLRRSVCRHQGSVHVGAHRHNHCCGAGEVVARRHAPVHHKTI
jgi:hypothetical protein